jgi:hypothetical protein
MAKYEKHLYEVKLRHRSDTWADDTLDTIEPYNVVAGNADDAIQKAKLRFMADFATDWAAGTDHVSLHEVTRIDRVDIL